MPIHPDDPLIARTLYLPTHADDFPTTRKVNLPKVRFSQHIFRAYETGYWMQGPSSLPRCSIAVPVAAMGTVYEQAQDCTCQRNFKMKSNYADASSQIQTPLPHHGLPKFVVTSIVVEHDWHRLRSNAAKRILHISYPSQPNRVRVVPLFLAP